MASLQRRYDIDWLRVIAIGLLLIYHAAIGFQSWGIMIGFVTTRKTWPELWIPMGMLNIWRIPFLFFVSGMGVYFAMQKRNWLALFKERAQRILVPFVFGMFAIVPLSTMLWQHYFNWDVTYGYNPGHLWFLGNIFAYVLILTPVFTLLLKHQESRPVAWFRKMFHTPLGLIPIVAVFIAEALILRPNPYELYAMTWHGFFLGLIAFFFGFCFVLSGSTFWAMILRWRWFFVIMAVGLYLTRAYYFDMRSPMYLLVTESDCWILSVFAFGYKYLNHPSKVLTYLSQAAYPVYILHMIFLFLGGILIFSLDVPAPLQFLLVLIFTLAGCFAFYEFIIRRVNWLRPLFGLKVKARGLEIKREVLSGAAS